MHDILAIVSYYNCFRDFIMFFHHSPQYKQQNGSQTQLLGLGFRLKLGHIGSLVCGNLLLALLIRQSLGGPPLLGRRCLLSNLLGSWIGTNGLMGFLVDILNLEN